MTTHSEVAPGTSSGRYLALLACAALGAAAVIAVYHVDPSSGRTVWCPYRAVTGMPCPGCGMTRAVHFLMHADVVRAFSYNPLLFLAAPVALAFAVAPHLVGEQRGGRWRTSLAWIMLAITLMFWVWRNTPWYPLLRL